MKFLHYELQLSGNDIVEVALDKQANVRLLDAINFSHYQMGRRHKFYGGLAKVSPLRIQPPHPGNWHLVVDLGGYAGTVHASVRTISA